MPPLALVAGVFACRGPSVPVTPGGENVPLASQATCVPYPPPAPKVEEIPARPSKAYLWLDGEWAWHRERWVWRPGGWVVPPPETFYAAWRLVRQDDGALVYYPGRWSHPDEARVDAGVAPSCPPPPSEAPPMVAVDAALEADVHVGPVLVYPADAPSAVAKIEIDATIPGDAVEEAARPLIGPPD